MGIKRHKPEEIVSKLWQVEVLMEPGLSRLNAIRQIGVVGHIHYRLRTQNGGVGVGQLKDLKRPQKDETAFIEGIIILFHAKF